MPCHRNIVRKRPAIVNCKIPVTVCLLVFISIMHGFSQPAKRIDSLKQVIKLIPANNQIKKAHNLLKLGELYVNEANYTSAMDCYQSALALAEDLKNDSLRARAYKDMAIVAYNHGDIVKDSLYGFTALNIYRKIKDKLNEAICLKNMGASYLNGGKLQQAKKCFDQALPIFKQLNKQPMIASVYSYMALIYKGDYRKTIELELAAKKIWDKYPPDNDLALINVGNMGVAYFYMVRFDSLRSMKHDTVIPADSTKNLKKAGIYIRQAIQMAKQHHDAENAAYYTEILSELQFHDGDYKNAYLNYEFYQDTNDSIFSQQNKNKIAELESRNELEKKNREIDKQKQHARDQRRNILLLLSGLITLTIIGMLFYRLSVVRKQKNAELTLLNGQLDNANKTKAKFFAILTHDLRSPIANLLNFLQLQKRHPQLLTEEQKAEQEKKITNSATSLLSVMEEILLWSKGQMENFEPEMKQVAVTTLFAYLKDFFVGVSGIDFQYQNDEGLSVYTDENYLKTIMQNLTQNAINALKTAPGATITWRAWQENGTVKLSVTDNGSGMSAELVKKFHENNPVSSARQGLGLHLVKDMAQIIGCSIVLQSAPNSGTVFTLIMGKR